MRCECLISPFCTGSVSGCSAKRRAYYEYYTCITIRTRTEDSEIANALVSAPCLETQETSRAPSILECFLCSLFNEVRLDTCLPLYQRHPWQSNIAKGQGRAVMIIVG